MGRRGGVDLVRMNTEQVKEKMAVRLWKTADVAEHAGLDRQTVHRAVAGKPIWRHTALKIARAFGEAPEVPGLREMMGELDMEALERDIEEAGQPEELEAEEVG